MKIFTSVLVLFLFVTSTSCDRRASSEVRDQKRVQKQQEQYAVAQPIPAFDYSLERDIVTQLYGIRNQKVATHSVWRGDMSVIEGDCPSIGYAIPYDTSLTNPLQTVGSHHSLTTIEQPEPNGIFQSKNSDATWVFCVVNGAIAPIPVEARVTTYPFPVNVDYETNRVTWAATSKPSVTIETKR